MKRDQRTIIFLLSVPLQCRERGKRSYLFPKKNLSYTPEEKGVKKQNHTFAPNLSLVMNKGDETGSWGPEGKNAPSFPGKGKPPSPFLREEQSAAAKKSDYVQPRGEKGKKLLPMFKEGGGTSSCIRANGEEQLWGGGGGSSACVSREMAIFNRLKEVCAFRSCRPRHGRMKGKRKKSNSGRGAQWRAKGKKNRGTELNRIRDRKHITHRVQKV